MLHGSLYLNISFKSLWCNRCGVAVPLLRCHKSKLSKYKHSYAILKWYRKWSRYGFWTMFPTYYHSYCYDNSHSPTVGSHSRSCGTCRCVPCSVPDSFGDAPLMRQLRLCDRWLQSRPLQGDGSKWLQWSLLRHRSCQVFVKQSCKVAPRPTGELCPAVWTESVFDCSFILCVGRSFSSVWLCFCWTACKPTDSGLRYLVHQRWDVLVTWFIQDVFGPSREPHIHRLALHLRRHHLAS